MAERGGVRVEGLTQLTRDLERLGLDVEDLKDAFSAIADEGAQLASSFAPRKTGRLQSTIRGNRAKNKAIVSAGRAAVPYASVQNYGWAARHIKPTHYLQRADEALRPRALQELDDALIEAVRKRGLA